MKKPVEDESDLNEPIINLKPKRSKTSKAARKCINASVFSSSTVDIAIKPSEILVSEGSPHVGGNSGQIICIKVETSDPKQLGYQNTSHSADALWPSCNNHDEGLNPGGTSANEFHNMVLCDYREPYAQEYQSRVTNKILYNHVEVVEPISMLVPRDATSVRLEQFETDCEEFLDLPPLAIQKPEEVRNANSINSPSQDQNSNVCIRSRCSSIQISDMDFNGTDGCNGLHMEFNSVTSEDKREANLPDVLEESLSSRDKNSAFYPGIIISLKIEGSVVSTEDTIADEEQPSTCSFDVITKNGLNFEGYYTKVELLKAEKKQTSELPITAADSQFSLEKQTCCIADTISTLEPHLPPENLLSTRKVNSPSSQERLHMAMDSIEIWNDAGQNIVSECKGNIFEKTAKKTSSPRLEIQYDRITVNHRQSDKVRQQRVIISPRRNIKKSQISRGNLEGPHFSRTLPNLSTECTSIQSCSESAILFSKQQMYDIESLAAKLVNELKSMKDIVEQKLLFEAYRNVSVKNDADEVKSAIKNASKVEETSRKWLSIMARDCNRFCKIMKMTPNATAASKDIVPRERRKIMFADEAGGKLCHVKSFEDGTDASSI